MNVDRSKLISCEILSPNNSGIRNHIIDTITPHCVVGQCTAQSLGQYFAKKSTKASSNYGIGKDGKIGLYVREQNRSWCSSNAANDNRAITIECASAAVAPYKFNQCVYNALVELCVDICKRYGKKHLLWLGTKQATLEHKIKDDEIVLTVHRWFANKSCPGDWMYQRMGQLAMDVTKRLGGDVVEKQTPVNDIENTIWDFLLKEINNAYGVAGLMGNLYAESGLRPNNLQNSYEKKFNLTDDTYTEGVDNGTYPNFVNDKAGYGLAQWTFWSRKQALYQYAKQCGASIGNLQMQLEYLIRELKGYKTVWNTLITASSVKQASDIVLTQFERPADQSDNMKNKRAGYGQNYYNKYAGKTLLNTEYSVIIIASALNVRKGPSTNYQIIKTLSKGTVVTITDNINGWGKIKGNDGWISLAYTKRV